MPTQKIETPLLEDGLPAYGYVRLAQFLPLLPIARATFLAWVAAGKVPRPYRFGPRAVAWPVETIRELLAGLQQVTPETIDPNIKAANAERARRRAELL